MAARTAGLAVSPGTGTIRAFETTNPHMWYGNRG